MMDPKDTVVSRELTDAELEGIIGGMGRAKRREARSNKSKGTSTTPGMTTRTTTPMIMPSPMPTLSTPTI